MAREALDIVRQTLGSAHLESARISQSLAICLIYCGEESKALELLRESEEILDRIIGAVFRLGSDRRRMAFQTQLGLILTSSCRLFFSALRRTKTLSVLCFGRFFAEKP